MTDFIIRRPVLMQRLVSCHQSQALGAAAFECTRGLRAMAVLLRSRLSGTECGHAKARRGAPRAWVLVLLLLNHLIPGRADLEAFEGYIQQFGKKYRRGEPEFQLRYENWLRSKARIEESAARHSESSFTLRVNQFSDMSEAELNARFPSRRDMRSKFQAQDDDVQSRHQPTYLAASSLPESVDWRYADANPLGIVAVTPVKNQGLCGACWGFSTVAAIEGAVAINTGFLNELSVQELIDCVHQNDGCTGGDFEYSFQYAVNYGLQSSATYRFIQGPSGYCQANASQVVSQISTFGQITMCSTSALQSIVATRPVATAIDASCDSFIHYGGGIYTASCGKNLNHAVTIVGYGSEAGTPYWVIKNSWGSGWGEKGFGRIKRSSGSCGISRIEEYAFYAAGGIAFVNGTAFQNDDFLNARPKLTLLDKILSWKYLTVVLGIAMALMCIPIITTLVRVIKKRCRAGPSSSSRRGGPQRPQTRTVALDSLDASAEDLAAIRMLERLQATAGLEWACPYCTFINRPSAAQCEMCQNYPGVEAAIVQLNDDETRGVMVVL